MVNPREGVTRFLNVDLDISSRDDLAPLARALEPQAFTLHCDVSERGCSARLELSRDARTPDQAIRRLAAAVAKLPTGARRLWRGAQVRDFNVGIAPGAEPWCAEFAVEPETLRAASELGARVVFTIYGHPAASGQPSASRKDAADAYAHVRTLGEALAVLRRRLRDGGALEYAALLSEAQVRAAIRVAIQGYNAALRGDAYWSEHIQPIVRKISKGAWQPGCSFSCLHTLRERRGKKRIDHHGLGVRLDVATPGADFDGFALPILDAWFGGRADERD